MRGLLPFAFLLGCAHPTPDIRLTSARGLDPPTLARGEPQLWRARALQFSAQLGRRPTVGELTRSASLWARAGEDARARRLEQRAREVVDEAGLDVEFVVLGPAFGVERVFWDGSLIGIVRAVHAVQPFGFAAFRLELWSPDEPSAPVWVEYSRSPDLWARGDAVDARARVVEGDDRTVLDRRVLPDREHLRVVFGDGEVATYRVADGVVVDRVRLRCSVGDTMDWVLARPWDATGTQSDAFACARPWRASISIDGRFVATSGPVLRVHDTTSGRVMTSRPGFRSPERHAWSREGQWVSVEDAGGASVWSEEAGWGTMSTLRGAEPAGSVIPRWVAGRLDIPIDGERVVRWDFDARVGRVVRPQYGARGLHAHRIGVSSV